MFTGLRTKFKKNPSLYYSASIAATWAGAGSLVVGMQMAQNYGIVPFIFWATGNILACIVFGIFAMRIPKLRDVFRSKVMQKIIGLMSVFHIWINMNGIESTFAETILTKNFGMILAYAIAVFFVFLLIRYGMIRNVLTDDVSWTAVYTVGFILTTAAIIYSRGNMNMLSWGFDNLRPGIEKGILLLPGAFLYPYFYEILDYNNKNEDGTKEINVQRAFVIGGLLFGAYLIFVFLLAWTNFNPFLNILKAVFISLVAVSTISSFLYSVYITFGSKIGIGINILAVVAWQILIPMGVLGVWTLMASIRIFIVIGAIAFSFIWYFLDRKKKVKE